MLLFRTEINHCYFHFLSNDEAKVFTVKNPYEKTFFQIRYSLCQTKAKTIKVERTISYSCKSLRYLRKFTLDMKEKTFRIVHIINFKDTFALISFSCIIVSFFLPNVAFHFTYPRHIALKSLFIHPNHASLYF